MTQSIRPRTDSSRLTAADTRQAAPSRDASSLLMTPLALMGLMLLSIGVVSAMGQLGF